MSGREETRPSADLIDLPLRGERADAFALPLSTGGGAVEPLPPAPAPISGRWVSTASDVAVVVLIVSAALLVAGSTGGWPSPAGLVWAAAFALYLSFFAVVVPLVFFGRTVGMALSGLAAMPRAGQRGLALREAALRWLGTLMTALSLGVALLFTVRRGAAPTPADAMSGRPLGRSDPSEEP